MLYQPELILILWLLPVTAMVLFPLFLAPIGGMVIFFRREGKAVIRLQDYQASQASSPDQREQERVAVQGLTAFVEHKSERYPATVANVSPSGVCLSDIPHLLFEEGERLKLWLQQKDEQIEMVLRPRWEKVKGSSKMIGAEIVNPSREWVDSFSSGTPALSLATAA